MGPVLETGDLALGLGNALLRFEDLAIDPIQFTQQFLSASLQVVCHSGVPDAVEIETGSVGTSARPIDRVQTQLQRSLCKNAFIRDGLIDSASDNEERGTLFYSGTAAPPLAFSSMFAKVLGWRFQPPSRPERKHVYMPTVSVPFQDLAKRIQQQEAELAKLRQELESRRGQLSELTRRKESLKAELAKVEKDIAAVGQVGVLEPTVSAARTPPSTSSKRRPTGTGVSKGVSLPTYLVELVRKAKGPITAKELTAEVVRNKFPTTSKNVVSLVKTRVHDLVKKGLLRRAGDSSGLVLAQAPRSSKSTETKVQAAMPKNEKKGANNSAKAAQTTTPVEPAKWRSLHEVVTHVLAKSSRPLSAQELAEGVTQSGYESKSKDLKNVIWVSIGKMTTVERVPGKGYRLKKGKISGAKKKT